MPRFETGRPETGGRKAGAPNATTGEVRARSQRLLNSPKCRKAFRARLEAGQLAPAPETMLWSYANGRPPADAPEPLARHLAAELTADLPVSALLDAAPDISSPALIHMLAALTRGAKLMDGRRARPGPRSRPTSHRARQPDDGRSGVKFAPTLQDRASGRATGSGPSDVSSTR